MEFFSSTCTLYTLLSTNWGSKTKKTWKLDENLKIIATSYNFNLSIIRTFFNTPCSEGCYWKYTANWPTSVKLCRNILQLMRIRKFEGAESESHFFPDVSTFLLWAWFFPKWVMLYTVGKRILRGFRVTYKTYPRNVSFSSYENLLNFAKTQI